MDMDLYGLHPGSEVGKHYHVSDRDREIIYKAIHVHCENIVDDETLDAIQYREEDGLEDGELCIQIAVRLEELLRYDMVKIGTFLDVDFLQKDRERLSRFCDFLRHCGGFERW